MIRRCVLVIFFLFALVLAGCTDSEAATTVEPDDALEIASQSDVTVIDVRTPDEFEDGHLVGAVNVDLRSESFRAEIDTLERDDKYLLYCATGNRSAQAAAIMAELNFTDVSDAGGYQDLVEAGAKTETGLS